MCQYVAIVIFRQNVHSCCIWGLTTNYFLEKTCQNVFPTTYIRATPLVLDKHLQKENQLSAVLQIVFRIILV